jgi:hypothetical protein
VGNAANVRIRHDSSAQVQRQFDMILTNSALFDALDAGRIVIDPEGDASDSTNRRPERSIGAAIAAFRRGDLKSGKVSSALTQIHPTPAVVAEAAPAARRSTLSYALGDG